MTTLKAPFPWFGGKSRAAHLVWAALGDVGTYCEPFAGSLACLLARPNIRGVETVNDLDGYLVNFWRAVQADPEAVAAWADWPVAELDLTARHHWLVTTGRERLDKLAADPEFFDAQVAGWWVWGLCSWIGSGWCAGNGPWRADESGVLRKLPHLSNAGRGINRQLPHLGNAGQGILSNAEQSIADWLQALSSRLRGVRITCGEWHRILGPSSTRAGGGVCGVLLDPPYPTGSDLYGEATEVYRDVWAWAEEHGNDPYLRIIVCGYEGDWTPPTGWQTVPWKAKRAFNSANGGEREQLWCSPACLPVAGRAQGLLGLEGGVA